MSLGLPGAGAEGLLADAMPALPHSAWLLGLLLCAQLPAFAAAAAPGRLVTDFGPFAPDTAPPVAAATLQRAIDACAAAGGGRVIVPAGPAVTVGGVQLRSHVELHLERGAVLRGSPHHADFPVQSPWPIRLPADQPVTTSGVILSATDAEDIALTGGGLIDGNGGAYVTKRGPEIYECPNERPFTVVFTRCRHVTVRDVTLKDSPFWTFRLLGCDDVLVDGIRIDGDRLMPNNDGLDIDWSSNVRVQGCDISTGDDCISLKTTPAYSGPPHPCENIVVTNCTLHSHSAAVAVGCDVQGPVRHAIFSNLAIRDSHRGLAVRLSCNGSIEHILFSNITVETRLYDDRWWGRGEPIQILALPWTKDYHNGVIRDIRFSNIVARGENGVVVVSNEPGHIQDIVFDRVSLEVGQTTAWDGRRQDFRPFEIGPPAMPEIPVSGYLLRYAGGITWRDCTVAWGEKRPAYYRQALDAEHSTDLHAEGLTGPSADPAKWPARRIE